MEVAAAACFSSPVIADSSGRRSRYWSLAGHCHTSSVQLQVHLKSSDIARRCDRRPTALTIGELARRSGVAASALRYYETIGLIRAERTGGDQRRYPRSTLRRVAFVRAAQRVGLSLEEARDAMATLPADRAPDATEWSHVARAWQRRIDDEIAQLQRLRDATSPAASAADACRCGPAGSTTRTTRRPNVAPAHATCSVTPPMMSARHGRVSPARHKAVAANHAGLLGSTGCRSEEMTTCHEHGGPSSTANTVHRLRYEVVSMFDPQSTSILRDPGLFGRLWAAGYDDGSGPNPDPGPAVDFLADRAQGGPVLELAIGTGRVALPLAARGSGRRGRRGVAGNGREDARQARRRGAPGRYRRHGGRAGDRDRSRWCIWSSTRCSTSSTRSGRRTVSATWHGSWRPVARSSSRRSCPIRPTSTGTSRCRCAIVTEDSATIRVHRYDRAAQQFIRQTITFDSDGVHLKPFAMRYGWPRPDRRDGGRGRPPSGRALRRLAAAHRSTRPARTTFRSTAPERVNQSGGHGSPECGVPPSRRLGCSASTACGPQWSGASTRSFVRQR